MAIKDKLKGASRKPTYVPLYNLEPYTITEYLPEHGCYKGVPAYSTTAPRARTLYAISGSSSVGAYTQDSYQGGRPIHTFQQGPQIQKLYEPQTVVLVAIPPVREGQSQDTDVGLILGDITIKAFMEFDEPPTKVNEPCKCHNLDITDIHTQIQKVNQTSSKHYHQGKVPETAVAGDYVIAGSKSVLSIDNYGITIQTNNARTTYSSITDTITEQAFLKHSKTATEVHDNYIIGTDILSVSKQSYNIYDSYFNCYDVKDNKLVPNNVAPLYRSQTFKGELVEGEHRFIYSHASDAKEQLPLFHEHIGLDGSLTIEGAKGVHLKKTVNMPSIVCEGERLQSKDENTFKFIDAKKADNDIKSVKPNEASLPLDDTGIDVAITKDKTTKLLKGEASLDVNEDGSICLRDAWGSYILLSEGNIQIHAANNLFIVPGRDCINISGGVHTIKAAKDIQMDATDGDILMSASDNAKINANFLGLDAKTTAGIQSKNVLLKGSAIKLDGDTEGGVIQIGNKNCTLTMAASNLTLWGTNTAALATERGCLSVTGNTVRVCGPMYVGGDLTLGVCKASITIDGVTTNIDSTAGSLRVTDGSLLVGGSIRSTDALIVKQVVAETVAAKESSNGKMYKVRHVPLDPIKNALDRVKSSKDITLTTKSPDDWTDVWETLTFTFDKSSKACYYILKDELELQSTPIKAESINIKDETSYIYPGEVFWASSGLCKDKIAEDGSTKRTLTGFSNYRFNNNNVTVKGEK